MVKKKPIQIDGVVHNCDVIEKDGNNYVRLRSLTPAGYGVEYDTQENLASITSPMRRAAVPVADDATQHALAKLQAVCGLQDATLEYLRQYAWGDDLVQKLAAGMKDES